MNPYRGVSYQGQSQFSIRHSQWLYSTDVGVSFPIHNGGYSYSRLGLHFTPRIRISEHWVVQQDWFIQLFDKGWDTLFHSSNVGVVPGALMMSVGYMQYDHPVLGYSYFGLGTGMGETFMNDGFPLTFFAKSRKGVTHNTYFSIHYIWTFNDFMNMYDDNIMVGISFGKYWGRFSKYKR